jgi:hypothetical protein
MDGVNRSLSHLRPGRAKKKTLKATRRLPVIEG